MTIRYKGRTSVCDVPGSPRYHFGADEVTASRVLRGKIDELLRSVPQRGSLYPELLGGQLRVVDADLVPTKAGLGELTINLSTKIENGGASGTAPVTYQLERDWTLVDRPIELHPMFKDLTDEDRAKVRAWQDLDSRFASRKRLAYYPKVDDPKAATAAHWGQLSGLLLKLAKKIRKGQDTYWAVSPVVRRTSQYTRIPPSSTVPKRGSPPIPVSGFEFLKTADRAVREGKSGPWVRTEEWTGAAEWDSEIYA